MTRQKRALSLRLPRSSEFCPRAGCVHSARTVQRAGWGNGAWFDTMALTTERVSNSYADLNNRATSRLYMFWGDISDNRLEFRENRIRVLAHFRCRPQFVAVLGEKPRTSNGSVT